MKYYLLAHVPSQENSSQLKHITFCACCHPIQATDKLHFAGSAVKKVKLFGLCGNNHWTILKSMV